MVAVNGVNEDKQALATGIQQIIDGKIAELVDMVRDNQRDIATLKSRITAAKAELRELLELRGAGWSDNTGYARIASDGVRKAYDTQALDELILSDPLQYGWLKDFRKEVSVKGGIQVR